MTCFWLFAQENSNTFMSPTFLVFGGVLYQHQPFDVEPNEPTNLESSCSSSLFTSWRRWISQKCSNSNRSNSKTCDNGNVWKSETIENRPAHKPRYPVDIQSLLPWFPPCPTSLQTALTFTLWISSRKARKSCKKQLPCLLLLLYKWIYAHYNVTLHTETCCQTMSNVLIQDSTR